MSDVNVHAFLLADRVIREDNGKFAIIGSFNRFSFPKFPVVCAPWHVYLNMDNFTEGEHEFALNLTRKGSGETVFSGGGKFSVDDRNKGAELFDREGKYLFTLMVDGRELSDRILVIDPVQGSGSVHLYVVAATREGEASRSDAADADLDAPRGGVRPTP